MQGWLKAQRQTCHHVRYYCPRVQIKASNYVERGAGAGHLCISKIPLSSSNSSPLHCLCPYLKFCLETNSKIFERKPVFIIKILIFQFWHLWVSFSFFRIIFYSVCYIIISSEFQLDIQYCKESLVWISTEEAALHTPL